MNLIKQMFCLHKWRVVSEKIILSSFERATACIKEIGTSLDTLKLSGELCDNKQTFIQIIACDECGKLKRYVAKN